MKRTGVSGMRPGLGVRRASMLAIRGGKHAAAVKIGELPLLLVS